MEVQYLWTRGLCQVRLIEMSSSGKTDMFVFGIPQTSLRMEYCQGSSPLRSDRLCAEPGSVYSDLDRPQSGT